MKRITGTTENGFDFEIDLNTIQSYEYLELLADVEENLLKLPKLMETTLGVEQKNKLIAFLKSKNEDGICTFEDIQATITEIFQISGEKSTEIKK